MEEVAVIIVNWNRYQLTRDCLKSLSQVRKPSLKVVLVDNASEDDSVHLLKAQFKDPHYIVNDENLGFTGGNNVGIQWAIEKGYNYIGLLNNDTVVDENFLEPLLVALQSNDQIGAVQPVIYHGKDTDVIWNSGGKLNKWTGRTVSLKKRISEEVYSEWLTGCCILTRSKVLKEVGDLFYDFFAYYEDVDWSLRVRSMGYNLLVEPESFIYHIGGASSKAEKGREGIVRPIVHYWNTRNSIWVLRRNGYFFQPTCYFFVLIRTISYSCYFLLRGRFNKLKMVWLGFSHGLGVGNSRGFCHD